MNINIFDTHNILQLYLSSYSSQDAEMKSALSYTYDCCLVQKRLGPTCVTSS